MEVQNSRVPITLTDARENLELCSAQPAQPQATALNYMRSHGLRQHLRNNKQGNPVPVLSVIPPINL